MEVKITDRESSPFVVDRAHNRNAGYSIVASPRTQTVAPNKPHGIRRSEIVSFFHIDNMIIDDMSSLRYHVLVVLVFC